MYQASEQCGKLDVANLLRTLDGLKDQALGAIPTRIRSMGALGGIR